jgi:hypothetical protein
MSGDVRFQQHRDTRQSAEESHAIQTETLGEHAPSNATIKNWVAQFKHGDFSTCAAPRPG